MLVVEVQNLGTNARRPRLGNYRYRVLVNTTVVARGELVDHERAEWWRQLLRMVVEDDLADEPDGAEARR